VAGRAGGQISIEARSYGARKGRPSIVTAILACGPPGGQVARGMKKISYKGYRFPPEII
jgi:hypothetical protein